MKKNKKEAPNFLYWTVGITFTLLFLLMAIGEIQPPAQAIKEAIAREEELAEPEPTKLGKKEVFYERFELEIENVERFTSKVTLLSDPVIVIPFGFDDGSALKIKRGDSVVIKYDYFQRDRFRTLNQDDNILAKCNISYNTEDIYTYINYCYIVEIKSSD